MRAIVLLLLIGVGVCTFSCRTDWNKYHLNKLYQPHAKITEGALKLFRNSGVAIDFGCGCGNDTSFLINEGWKVWAIDGESSALEILRQRNDITSFTNLTTLSQKFENITWNHLPNVDLFLAVNTLPFCKPDKFYGIWKNITSKVNPNGRFAGHFFGIHYEGFTNTEMTNMTFLSKENVLCLFENFEIESFREIEEDGVSGTGRKIHAHIFEIIARKH